MPYHLIENFAQGMDRRRTKDSSPSGSMWEILNAFVNEGGQIEKRKSFVRNTLTTNALRYLPGNTRGPARGVDPFDVIFFSARSRDELASAVGWPGTSASNVAHKVGNYDLWMLERDSTSGTTFNGWCLTSTSYLDTDYQAIGYLGRDARYRFSATIDFSFSIGAAGRFTPGDYVDDSSNPWQQPRYNFTTKTKLYSIEQYRVSSGDIAGGAVGTGFANLLSQEGFIGLPMAASPYYDQIVVFGTIGAQFWSMDPDWAKSQYLRTLGNVALVAPRTVTPWAAGDVLYLSKSGVRSLQARDSSNYAAISDIGSAIDNLLRDHPSADLATALVLPSEGQFWLFLGKYVYVLSQSRSTKVLAWSRYELPTGTPGGWTDFALEGQTYPFNGKYPLSNENVYDWAADACQIGFECCYRTFGDEFYIYGGSSAMAYDNTGVVLETPYLDFGKPFTTKTITSIDLKCEGTWTVYASQDPNNELYEEIATVTNSTMRDAIIDCQFTSTTISLRLTCTDAAPSKVASIGIHYSDHDQG